MGNLTKITKEQFAVKYEPLQMLQDLMHIKTMSDAINTDANGIAFYSKHLGMDTVLATIEAHLIALGMSLNVHEKLSQFQCKEIAIEVMSMYYYMNMTEIAYVFRRAKRGEFGKINYSINMPDVLQWFAVYSEERAQHYMRNSEQQNKAFKNGKTVEDGKLVTKLVDHFTPQVVAQLGKVKEEIPEGFDKEEYKKVKNDYNKNGINQNQNK